ncbi:MAG: hypothetical protein WC966_02670 [Bradymonadales bacterium]
MDDRLFFNIEEAVQWAQHRVVESFLNSTGETERFTAIFGDLPSFDDQGREDALIDLALLTHVLYSIAESAKSVDRLASYDFTQLLEQWRVLAAQMRLTGDERLMSYGIALCSESILSICDGEAHFRALGLGISLQAAMSIWRIISKQPLQESYFIIQSAVGVAPPDDESHRRALALSKAPVSLQKRRLERARMEQRLADCDRAMQEILYPYAILGKDIVIERTISFLYSEVDGRYSENLHKEESAEFSLQALIFLPYRILASVVETLNDEHRKRLESLLMEHRDCEQGANFVSWLHAQAVLEEVLSLFLRGEFVAILNIREKMRTERQTAVFSYFSAMSSIFIGRASKASAILQNYALSDDLHGLPLPLASSFAALRAYLFEREKLHQLACDCLITDLSREKICPSNALYLAELYAKPESMHEAIKHLEMLISHGGASIFGLDRLIETRHKIAQSSLILAQYSQEPVPLLDLAMEFGDTATKSQALQMSLRAGSPSDYILSELQNMGESAVEEIAAQLAISELSPEHYDALYSLAGALRAAYPKSLASALVMARALSEDPSRALDHLNLALERRELSRPSAEFMDISLQIISTLSEFVGDPYLEASLIAALYQHFGTTKPILLALMNLLQNQGHRAAATKAAFMDRCGAQGFLELLESLKSTVEQGVDDAQKSDEAPNASTLMRRYPLLLLPPLMALPYDAYLPLAAKLMQSPPPQRAQTVMPEPAKAAWEHNPLSKASDAFDDKR